MYINKLKPLNTSTSKLQEKVIKLTCVVITGGAAEDDLNYTCKEKVIKGLSVIIHYTL